MQKQNENVNFAALERKKIRNKIKERKNQKNANLLEKRKGNEKHKIKAGYEEIQALENPRPGTPCFHRPCPPPLPSIFATKWLDTNKGIWISTTC